MPDELNWSRRMAKLAIERAETITTGSIANEKADDLARQLSDRLFASAARAALALRRAKRYRRRKS
jgi:hypothetical protein